MLVELKFDFDNPKYEYIDTMEKVDKALEALEKEPTIGIDIESTGFDPYTDKLLLVQLGTSSISYIFDARKLKLNEIPRFKELIENPKILKLMHNGKFDYQFIKKQAGASVFNIYDTMLAEGVLYAGINPKPPSLKALVQTYLNLNLKKDIRESFENYSGKINEEQLKYAALDTLVMFPIFEAQIAKLKAEGLINIAKLEFAVTKVVAEMELYGVYIDTKKWRGILKKLEEKRDILAAQFQETIKPYYAMNHTDLFGNTIDSINLNSQVQLMDLFNNKLGVNISSTGDAILAYVEHPIAKQLRDYRGYEKLISAFGDTLLSKRNKITGRFHPDFFQLGAATGRFSCSNPNFQQIPRNSKETPFRECFVPEKGNKLVVSDYSNMEMRILADLSGDKKMIGALTDGLDIHSYTASLMFNLDYTPDFKKVHGDLRQIAKPIGFGLMYGMGPVGLANRISIETGKPVTKEEGQGYMDKYFASYPSVQKFLEKMGKDAIKNGWSTTPAGRKRWYVTPEQNDPDYRKKVSGIQRQAKNHPIQGTNADAIKYALVFLYERMKKEGIEGGIILTVHDEVVCEVREDQAEAWAKIQSEEMVRAGELFIKKVPVISEPFVSDVWEH